MKHFAGLWNKRLAIAAALLLGSGLLAAPLPNVSGGNRPTVGLTVYAAPQEVSSSDQADDSDDRVIVEEQTLIADVVAPRKVLNAAESFPEALLADIHAALCSGETSVYIASYQIPLARESELWLAVKQKYPLDSVAAAVKARGYSYYINDNTLEKLNFVYAPSIEGTTFDQRRNRLQTVVDPVVNAAKDMSSYSKIIYIHDLLSVNGTYDCTYERYTGYEMLDGGTAVCQGYAEAFQMYMDLLNVPCVIATSDEQEHAWNMVKLDGNWYHIDVTWDDGLDHSGNGLFPETYVKKSRRYDYTLLTDAQMQADHKSDWLPHYNANSSAFANMPRRWSCRQVWVADRWYYYDDTTKALCSCNAYGGDQKTLYKPATGTNQQTLDIVTDAWDGVVVFLSCNDIMAYWTDTGHIGKLHTLTSAEKAKSALPDDCEMDSVAVDAQGKISYRYVIWKLVSSSGGSNTYQSGDAEGSLQIDLRGLAARLRGVYAKLDALPDSLTAASTAAAQEAVNAYDALLASLTETEATNLDDAHKAKAESVRTALASLSVVPATGVTLSQSTLVLRPNKTGTLNAIVTPADCTDAVVWTSSDTAIATVDGGVVTAGKNTGTAVITATAGSVTASCTVEVVKITGASSKLYEPWGMRFYAGLGSVGNEDIADRGIAVHKLADGVKEMAYEDYLADPQTQLFRTSDGTLSYDQNTGMYYATFTKGIYSYDIASSYLTLGFIRLKNGEVIYTNRPSFSMEAILKTNLADSKVSSKEKAICNCILALKDSVAKHYASVGVPSVSLEQTITRGSAQTPAALVKTNTESELAPQVTGVASRLIEPWGLRFYATFHDADAAVKDRGMVMLCKTYYSDSYKTSPDSMRLNGNAYVFRESEGTLTAQGSGNYYCTLTEGISSKDIADKYYTLAFVELQDGTYIYSNMASKSMKKVMETNDGLSTVPATEKKVGKDIIALYNAVQDYYNQ